METRRSKRARTLKPSENPKQEKVDNEETLGRFSGSSADAESPGYEQLREQRIKENMERMQKLGILDLSLKLKSQILPPKRSSSSSSRNPSQKPPSLPVSEPPRRSSRLKSVTPVSYSELKTKKKRETSKNGEIIIREGSKPEIYTEEHDKLLGDCKTSWTLFVDGCDRNGKRIYDQVKGKTCHQCRQKTLGRHTSCSKCDLVQGQFCGDCLYMRYGENVIEANQNPSWICPVCRGICNCSFCRQAKGWAATGPLYRKVSRLGFKSVAHYLIQTRRSQMISEDPATEPVSANELPLIADSGLQASLDNESLDENEGPDGSLKPQLHDKKDDGMEEEEVHDLENKHLDINGAYNKDDDDAVDNNGELKEEKEAKLYVELAVTIKPVLDSLLED